MKKEKNNLEKKESNHYHLLNSINYFIVLVSIITLSNCKTLKFDPVTETQNINNVMDQWHLDATNANFEGYINRFSNKSFYIGTDKTENWSKQKFASKYKPLFDRKKTWNFKRIERNVFFSKDKKTAWFNEILGTWMGTCRGSGILELENETWKIKQYVLSVTIPNSKMKEVVKIKKRSED